MQKHWCDVALLVDYGFNYLFTMEFLYSNSKTRPASLFQYLFGQQQNWHDVVFGYCDALFLYVNHYVKLNNGLLIFQAA